MTGNLIIVSAPSGAGKTTIVAEVVRSLAGVRESVSFTSRPPRAAEQDGSHYHFVSEAEFKAMAARGEFLEWAEVHGNLYGTSRRAVDELLAAGEDVVLTIDVQGAANARRVFPDAVSVFILPPSYETLLSRLHARGANRSDDLRVRLGNAQHEIEQYRHFDYIIVNDELTIAVSELAAIILAARCSRPRRAAQAEDILATFKATIVARFGQTSGRK
jgi:guanylate kinase